MQCKTKESWKIIENHKITQWNFSVKLLSYWKSLKLAQEFGGNIVGTRELLKIIKNGQRFYWKYPVNLKNC